MTFITCILIFLVVVLLVVLYLHQPRPSNFPPGPLQFPLVGNSPIFRKLCKKLGHQYRAFAHLAKEYGPVVGLRLGRHFVVVVSGVEALRQVLGREEFEGRPDTFFMRLRSMGTRRGITSTDGPNWNEQRSFTVRHLRNLGFGRQTMAVLIEEELTQYLKSLQNEGTVVNGRNAGKGILMDLNLAPNVLNVLWAIVAGTRFSSNDPKLDSLLKLLRTRSRAFDMAGGMLSQFPWLRHIAPKASGYTLLLDVNARMKEFLMETIEKHKEGYVEGCLRDLIDAYIREMKSRKEDPTSTFTDDQLVMVCLDMFIAGSETTSNTLQFAFLLAALHPEIQDKVQHELDTLLGRSENGKVMNGLKRELVLSDRTKLPYCEAFLTEAQRICHVTPVAGPRRAMSDTKVAGYDIPKDTVLLLNFRSVHMDVEHWKDPKVFRPERFLKVGDNGELELNNHDDWLLPFGSAEYHLECFLRPLSMQYNFFGCLQ
ncbi:methyl farnesoate epoxidase isoform X2 [Hetaerina americana]|uniref:methyl farnesoate epoxidase isoform X2 n=1 Tax=Hetaerina americana TaxID=62018 RepID=UPI003A7F2AE8